MRDYKLISADSHINEPPGLWVDRMPAKFKDRAPRMESFPEGEAWIFEGVTDPINFGANTNASRPREKRSNWIKWDDVPKGGYEPAERLKEMDQDGVDAELMYPTPRPSSAIFYGNEDREFHLACIQAYNDWLGEYCSHDTERLGGIALMPTTGLADAVEEYQRVMKMPGMRAAVLGRWPNGSLDIAPEDDKFWGAVQESGVPVNLHVSMVHGMPGDKSRAPKGASGEFRHTDAPIRAGEFIYTGTLDRFPDLKVAFIEVDCGWVPYVKEQMDDRFNRMNPTVQYKIKMPPSGYFDRNFYFAYITDSYGIKNRREIGIDHIMWSSDYPHTGADWPHSWDTINRVFAEAGVTDDEKKKMLAGNAARAYKFTNGK